MYLVAKLGDENYPFDVTMIRDNENEELLFFIRLENDAFMIAEKQNPGGKWLQKSGFSFTADLQDAIYEQLDNASFNKLVETALPIAKIEQHYFDTIR